MNIKTRKEVACWLLSASFLILTIGVGLAEPLHCAQCTEERLALCPQVSSDCQELAREPGCGCCLTCALKRGEPCGVYTARCGRSLSCHAKAGEARPLHALTKGQGICMDADELEKLRATDSADIKDYAEQENTAPEGTDISQDQYSPFFRLFPDGFDKVDPWNAITVFERLKAKKVFERNRKWKDQQGPCQKELYKAMDKLAKAQQRTGEEIYRFHIPNCNRNGFYHSKQCEASLDGERGKCWCVYPLTGRRIPGSPEIRGDLNCQQYLNSQE
ncbi:insulin-like growth factor-binding protein 1 [Bombina bombina]|uniref:insulin-like growth factor-binding protein 1 n=1 Tax=Bombina bombina TaxID=8345 RepID=UPI00235B0DF3|nr:insulin-like growth factor-binding protein 1 [Bombina bombina]